MKEIVRKMLLRWSIPVIGAILSLNISVQEVCTDSFTIHDQNSSAVVMCTGDLMCLGGQQRAAKTKETYDFTDSFSYLTSLFDCADLTIGNLETLISSSNPYTIQQKNINNNPNCNAMTEYLTAVKQAGFDVLVTANNHSLDGGVIGITETKEQLTNYGLLSVGTNTGNEVGYILTTVNNITIGILSYTELINQRNTISKKNCERYINCYSQTKVQKDVKAAKEAGAEFIIAYNHWGKENTHEITITQKEHALEMANAGVDLIIGSHSHCIQPVEYIETNDERRVLCIYSMGNLISSMSREINNDAIVLEVNLHKNSQGVFLGAYGYYPMKVITSHESKRFVIVPVSKVFNGGYTSQDLKNTQKRIKDILGDQLQELIP